MSQKHPISELAGDVMRRLELTIEEPGTERSTVKCAHPSGPSQRCPAANEGGDQPNRGGVTIEPVAFVGEGAPTNYGIKSGGATDFSPTKLPPLWKTPQGGVRLGGFVKADMSMVTVTAATKGRRPSAPAVIIDMMAWKAQRRHASHPFALATLSASKASPTTASRPKYTNLLIAQPTQE